MRTNTQEIQWTEKVARLIYRSLLGIITPEEEAALKAWREEDKAHEKLYLKLLDTTFLELEYRKLKTVDTARPMKDMQARLRLKLRRRLRLWKYGSIAATVALFLTVGTMLLRDKQPEVPAMTEQEATAYYASQIHPGKTEAVLTLEDGEKIALGADSAANQTAIRETKAKQPAAEPKMNRLTTERGGEFKVTLEDGTEVWLNAETQLVYPDSFATNERRVVLKGEAYFKVAKNEAKPFLVESNGQLVRVYGTEFNIRAYEEDADVYTTLVSGRISQQPLEGTDAELVLTPGRQAVFDKQLRATAVRPVDTESVTAWRKGRFVFEEQNLEQIMQDLGRWYDFAYRFEDDALRKTVFMGTVPRYGDFKDVLSILEKSGGLKFRMEERTVIISAR